MDKHYLIHHFIHILLKALNLYLEKKMVIKIKYNQIGVENYLFKLEI